MTQSIALLSFVVRDYDEAIAFFTDALRFAVLEDTPLGAGKRWVVVAPPDSQGAALLLAQAATPEQLAHIGNQTGGRVFLFLHTRDFLRDYHTIHAPGVRVAGETRVESDGPGGVFFDLYGKQWDPGEPPAALPYPSLTRTRRTP